MITVISKLASNFNLCDVVISKLAEARTLICVTYP